MGSSYLVTKELVGELACLRWRPDSRHLSTWHPTIQLWELACLRWRLASRRLSTWHPTIAMWERACSRRRP